MNPVDMYFGSLTRSKKENGCKTSKKVFHKSHANFIFLNVTELK